MTVQINTRKDSIAVFVRVSKKEFLVHSLTVQGAVTTFRLTHEDNDGTILLMSDQDTPSQTVPDVVYERRWPLSGDRVKADQDHVLGMFFLTGTKYTYKVIYHHDGQDETIIDIDYTGDDGDEQPKLLNVTTG